MPGERFEFEDFELDRSTYQLRRAGSVVHLERIPLDLLFLLIERRGKLVTRQEIFERIWGKNVFLDVDNSINIAVRKLRHALNDEPDAARFVVTVPARGYRFIAPIREDGRTAPVSEASPVSAVVEASPTAEAVDISPTVITKADVPPQKGQRRGILLPIGGIAFVVAVIVLIQQLSLRPPATTASIPPAQHRVLPLPSIPSIAVLPFTNMSGDREQEYFSDGITDDLIVALSRFPGLFVIARNSTFTYKGKAVKEQQVGGELGVKYVLEGGVRKAGGQVRITAQLVDATTGTNLWAESYDRPMKDIFALQDEIVRRIVTTMGLQLDLWEKYRVLAQRHTDNLEAYDYFLRALDSVWSFTKDGNAKARELCKKATELDPEYADAYVVISATYFQDWIYLWNPTLYPLDRAFESVRKALALNDSLPFAHVLLGRLLVEHEQCDAAIAEIHRAIALAPNSADAYFLAAETLSACGKPSEGLDIAQKAMRLDPKNSDWYLFEVGFADLKMERSKQAVAVLERFLISYPNHVGARTILAVAFVESGMMEQAHAEAGEIERLSPQFT
jgi:TolB-like protein/DNA-binding winged helix-turn-helix (wHTH) protein/Tfp pilus assembly protein PilF